jgi:hypothetical protein
LDLDSWFSLEKFLKKLLGRNDVEDALKRLDNLTQEEAKLATAEVLKITRGMDSSMKVMDSNMKAMDTNMKVLIDGAQTRFLQSIVPDGLCRQMVKTQETSCDRRNVCHF